MGSSIKYLRVKFLYPEPNPGPWGTGLWCLIFLTNYVSFFSSVLSQEIIPVSWALAGPGKFLCPIVFSNLWIRACHALSKTSYPGDFVCLSTTTEMMLTASNWEILSANFRSISSLLCFGIELSSLGLVISALAWISCLTLRPKSALSCFLNSINSKRQFFHSSSCMTSAQRTKYFEGELSNPISPLSSANSKYIRWH